MAYNEDTAQRIRGIIRQDGADFYEIKMFGGICFMVNEKMCCGTRVDKRTGNEQLLCRVGDEVYAAALETGEAIPMEFRGKPMKGYLFVTTGLSGNADSLRHWIRLCLDFNPFARSSRKR